MTKLINRNFVLPNSCNQIGISENQYPKRLREIPSAPGSLYYKGNIDIINRGTNIAVIGSRHVSDSGVSLAYQVGHALGKRGINVVNGLALGCDTYALQGALSAGGICVVVLPCGLEQVVPRSNTLLARELIAAGGCLVSEYSIGTPIQKYQYIQRDRLQSGICDAVIVIESEYDGGTMHTARYGIRQGRKLACIDSRLIRHSSGNRWLEAQNGVSVIRNMADLDCFVNALSECIEYRQMTLTEIESN